MASGPQKDGNKWIVVCFFFQTACPPLNQSTHIPLLLILIVEEKLDGKHDLEITPTETKETVFLSNLKKCVVHIKSKVTTISVVKCTETAIIFEDVVASFEITNCDRVQVQVNGAAPTMMVDKSSRVTIYLQTQASHNTEIITSLADQVNVVVAKGEADPLELSIPCQFKTTLDGSKLHTHPVEHVGV